MYPGLPSNGVAQNGHTAWKPIVPCGISTFAQYLYCKMIRGEWMNDKYKLNEIFGYLVSTKIVSIHTHLTVFSVAMWPHGLNAYVGGPKST